MVGNTRYDPVGVCAARPREFAQVRVCVPRARVRANVCVRARPRPGVRRIVTCFKFATEVSLGTGKYNIIHGCDHF